MIRKIEKGDLVRLAMPNKLGTEIVVVTTPDKSALHVLDPGTGVKAWVGRYQVRSVIKAKK